MRFSTTLLRVVPSSATTRTAIRLQSTPLSIYYRSLSTSSNLAAPRKPSTPSTTTTTLTSSAGSGQGGKKDKERAKKLKEKEKEKKLKDKEKDKAKKLKEKEKLAKQKAVLKSKAKQPVTIPKPKIRSSLHPPKAPVNAWGIFVADFIAERKAASVISGEKLATVPVLTTEAAPLYKALSPADKADLVRRSEERRAAYPKILNDWMNQLTPDMIKQENLVRQRRKKLGLSNKRPLRLEGEPKKPLTGFFRFASEIRNEQGIHGEVLQGETSITAQSKLIAAAWRAITDEEKKVYNDAAAVAQAEYAIEKKKFDEEVAARTEKSE